MKELFKNYLEEGKISEALMIGQNILNKDINDTDIFNKYFDLLISLGTNNDPSNCERFLQQATALLAYYAENADLTLEKIEDIKNKENILDGKKQSLVKIRVAENEDALNVLEKLLGKLGSQDGRKGFEDTLAQIGQVDTVIKEDYLTEKQKQSYEKMTSQCSEIVSKKMNEYNKKEQIEYNLSAVQAYENVFNYFKNKTVVENHKEIIKSLFEYDAAKLFNETLIYYNHVYNYVLSKLDDDEKFIITKYAIMSEKTR